MSRTIEYPRETCPCCKQESFLLQDAIDGVYTFQCYKCGYTDSTKFTLDGIDILENQELYTYITGKIPNRRIDEQ